MEATDPRHGTYAGAQTHWREGGQPCDTCRAAVRRYQKRRKFDVASNRPRKVDASEARAHLEQLAAQGMTDGAIAERSGVNITIVRHARVGINDKILTSTRDAIMGVEANPHPKGWVDGTGSRRRIQALAALGWTKRDIVASAATQGHEVTYAVLGWVTQARATNGRCRVQTRDAIAAAYEVLSMRLPESNRSSNRAKAWAQAAGHPPPLAWSEGTIDDPDAKPMGNVKNNTPSRDRVDMAVVLRLVDDGKRVRLLTAGEARAAVRILRGRGLSTTDIEKRYGFKVERYGAA